MKIRKSRWKLSKGNGRALIWGLCRFSLGRVDKRKLCDTARQFFVWQGSEAAVVAGLRQGSRAELEIQQINIEEKRALQENEKPEMDVTDIQRHNLIRQRYGEERQKRLNYCADARQRREEAEKFALGAEITQGTLERQVEVKVGDDMRELMNVEVLVEDDKIIAIRS